MTQRSWTRHLVVALAMVAALSLFPTATASATTETGGGGGPRVCRVDWRRSTWHVRKLIKCAARHYDVGVRRALRVAFRESRYEPRAFNASSCAKGIYQHLCRYWSERADTFGFDDRSAFNARANVIVTMRMVRRAGWGPWGY